MPEVKKKREPEKHKAEDLIVKVGKFRFYFQNYYTIISLVNDILLGALYVIGSIASIMNGPQWLRQWSYLAGAVFMLMRPILKIIRNVFIYDKQEFQNQVTDVGFEGKEKSRRSKDADTDYGESKNQTEKMDEIHEQEKNKTDSYELSVLFLLL